MDEMGGVRDDERIGGRFRQISGIERCDDLVAAKYILIYLTRRLVGEADQTKERGEIASKKAWEYGKTGFKDVSERNPKIGEKKRNHRVKKVTGRFESLIPILSIAIWSELFRIPSYHFGRKNNGHRRREEKYQGMDA
ncbi:hypothetical protein PCH_Pc13g01710 [Penicillium rubens Wisconsin 54-1255]|uniref:Uncharacterized protein n=1 Tax=Penicillium rubens (strain ATCC 28089 / DSM 1075 / NRRL 1951 / Wisconsin 54-1255) TaxID=500485 RepID=B6H1T1_PENRW|nr:hypothetical protein PCH_Pc13g01710 [Penicillium rubens Wisconsin 54-1255]